MLQHILENNLIEITLVIGVSCILTLLIVYLSTFIIETYK